MKSRALSKEEVDFDLLMTLGFHDLSRKMFNQLVRLLGVVVKNCMDPTFYDKFNVRKMYTETYDIRKKYIRGVN